MVARIKRDPLVRNSILDQLVNYSQLHLLAHHKLLRQSKEEEESLIEDLSFIDFATIDFVQWDYLAVPQHDKEQEATRCSDRLELMGVQIIQHWFDSIKNRSTAVHQTVFLHGWSRSYS